METFVCDNGCQISAIYYEDGSWCDCPNCEDESQLVVQVVVIVFQFVVVMSLVYVEIVVDGIHQLLLLVAVVHVMEMRIQAHQVMV